MNRVNTQKTTGRIPVFFICLSAMVMTMFAALATADACKMGRTKKKIVTFRRQLLHAKISLKNNQRDSALAHYSRASSMRGGASSSEKSRAALAGAKLSFVLDQEDAKDHRERTLYLAERAVSKDPKNAEASAFLGQQLIISEPARAVEKLRRALTLGVKDQVTTRMHLTLALVQTQQLKEAREQIEHLRRLQASAEVIKRVESALAEHDSNSSAPKANKQP